MRLVVGAFSTLVEAERATNALLDSGFAPDALTAASRAGGGRLLLVGRVAVHPIAQPATLADRTERAGAGAMVGTIGGAVVVVAALWLLPRFGADPAAVLQQMVPPVVFYLAAALAGGLAGGLLGALSRWRRGLPHDLALRYAQRLEQGDTVLGITTASLQQAYAARETMTIHGALLAHITRGTLEASAEPAEPAGLPPSPN
jgi:hypothetical protein